MQTAMISYLLVVFCLLNSAHLYPIHSESVAMFYLQNFGYLEDSIYFSENAISAKDSLANSLKDFQRYAGISQTGLLDNGTAAMMNTPRCGVKDKISHSPSVGNGRYVKKGGTWGKNVLTYGISSYPSTVSDTLQVDKEIARAVKVWSDVSKLSFEHQAKGQVDINIKFEKGEHGDWKPFDGPGKSLAHAYPRDFGGEVHFDSQEDWTVRQHSGINLFQAAVHAIGHSLGLSHSDVDQSVMYPFYRGYNSNFKLHENDIKAMQALYGPPENTIIPEKDIPIQPEPDVSNAPDLCIDNSVDASTLSPGGGTLIFKGALYWKIFSDNKIAPGYPKKISDDWDGLSRNVDAALSWSDGKIFLFKGERYWQFSGRKCDCGCPQLIRVGFPGIPDNLDAAFVWNGNGKTYFFKGDQYWRYDRTSDPPVNELYPQPISNWKGLPNNIDGGLQWTNNLVYVFKGTQYYRINDKKFEVDPDFPTSNTAWYDGCN